MPEELFDIVLIRIGRAGPAGSAAQPELRDEALDGPDTGGPVDKACGGQPTGVDAAAVAQEIFELGWEIEKACQRADLQGPVGRQREAMGASDVGNLAPGQAALSRHVVQAGDAATGDVEERPHHIRFFDELHQWVEAEDGGAQWA